MMLETVLGLGISGLEGLFMLSLISSSQGKQLGWRISIFILLANISFYPLITLLNLPEGLSMFTHVILPTLYVMGYLSLLKSKIIQPIVTAIFVCLTLAIGQGMFYLVVTPFKLVTWMMGSDLRFSILVLVMYTTLNIVAYLLRAYIWRTFERITYLLKVINRTECVVIFTFVVALYAIMGVSVNHWYASLVDGDSYDAFIALLLMAFSTITVILVFAVINSKKESEYELAIQQGSMQTSYREVINEIKGFWHSYANVMQVVDTLIYDDNLSIDQVREALKDYSHWHHKAQIKQKMNLVEVPHVVVGSVLANKYTMAVDMGVDFNVFVSGEGSINCNMRDLTEILGVALDNAIQAAKAAKGGVVVSTIFEEEGFKFIVTNSLVTEEGHILKFGQSHGIGLKRVQDLSKKNKRMSITHGVQNDTYQFELVIT